jgi:hypothetical protein
LINCKSADTVPTNQLGEASETRSAPNLAPRIVCDDKATSNQPISSSPSMTRAVLQITAQGVAQHTVTVTATITTWSLSARGRVHVGSSVTA